MNSWLSTNIAPAARPRGFIRVLVLTALLVGLSAAQAAEPSIPYLVKPGDKLIVITRDLLLRPRDWKEVARFNAMPDPDQIRPGQTLAIPVRLMKFTPAAGRLISVEGTVSFGATPAVVGAAVGEGSRLQTGPNSSVVIELADGSRVQLLPGSLAEVVKSREYALRGPASASSLWFSALIRLSQGAVETSATKLGRRATPLQIETPTTIVGVRGTLFRVAFDNRPARDSRAEVLEGAVRADNPAQKSGADLPQGTGAVIDPAQKEVRVVPLLPAPDLGAQPSNLTRRQATTWPMPALAGASAFRVQVASDARFERIVRDLKVGTASADLSSLSVGLWNVRVRGIDAQQLEGFDSATQLTLRDPRWRVTDSILIHENGISVLAWSGTLPDGEVLVGGNSSAELATDLALTQIVKRPTGGTNQLDLGDLKPGRYFIRMSAMGADGQAVSSEIYRLDVPGNWGTTVEELASPLQPVGP